MKRLSTLLLIVLLGAAPAWAGDEVSEEQVRAWRDVLEGRHAPDLAVEVWRAQRDAARAGLAALRPTERAIGVVREMLRGASNLGWSEGAEVARLLGEAAAPLLPDLLENVRDPSGAGRAAALRAIGAISARGPEPDRAARLLTTYLADERTALDALEGLHALGKLDDDQVVAVLLGPAWRRTNYRALLEREAEHGPLVDALLAAPSWHVRREVVHQLGRWLRDRKRNAPAEPWRPRLRRLLERDPSAAVRAGVVTCVSVLADRGEDVAPDLLVAMRDEDRNVRALAYGAASRRALAADPAITALLLAAAAPGGDPAERAGALWVLRDAPADRADAEGALRRGLADANETGRRNAAAALLERGATDKPLLDRLLDWIAEHGVRQPYPEPREYGRDLVGGRRRFDVLRFPAFAPSLGWNTDRVKALGPQVAPRLRERLLKEKAGQATTWIHALGHAGPAGLELLAVWPYYADGVMPFEVALVLAHGGVHDEDLVKLLDRVLGETLDPEIDADDETLRREALAAEALEALGMAAVPTLIARIQDAKVDENGWLPDTSKKAQEILERIGKPALPLVEAAAEQADAEWRFRALLETLRAK